MKIFLANPPCLIPLKNHQERYFVRAGSRWPFSVIKKRNQPLEYLPFPFFLAYTAALLEKEGFSVEVLDSIALNQTEGEFLEKIEQIEPDIILFETSTPTINYDYLLVKKIKKILPSILICLTGPHVSVYYKEAFRERPEIDFIFQGEYELAFKDLCLQLEKNRNFARIPGLVFKNNKKLVVNRPELIEDINVLPFPARHLFPSREIAAPTVYWDGFCQYRPAIQMHATRGCPFRCNFCLWNQVMYRNGKYRVFKPQRVIREIRECQKKYKAKEFTLTMTPSLPIKNMS